MSLEKEEKKSLDAIISKSNYQVTIGHFIRMVFLLLSQYIIHFI